MLKVYLRKTFILLQQRIILLKINNQGGEYYRFLITMARKSTSISNNHLMYLALLALSLLLVPFMIGAIQKNAVARYQASYAAEQMGY